MAKTGLTHIFFYDEKSTTLTFNI